MINRHKDKKTQLSNKYLMSVIAIPNYPIIRNTTEKTQNQNAHKESSAAAEKTHKPTLGSLIFITICKKITIKKQSADNDMQRQNVGL